MQYDSIKLDHIGLVVNDLEPSISWYVENFGFTIKDRFIEKDGIGLCYLQKNNTLYEIKQNPSISTQYSGKIDHIAYTSNDIKSDYEYYRKKGLKIITNKIEYSKCIGNKGADFFKILSQDDEVVEFCQRR